MLLTTLLALATAEPPTMSLQFVALLLHCFLTHSCYATSCFNPQRMHKGYGSRSVCLSVARLAATYAPRL